MVTTTPLPRRDSSLARRLVQSGSLFLAIAALLVLPIALLFAIIALDPGAFAAAALSAYGLWFFWRIEQGDFAAAPRHLSALVTLCLFELCVPSAFELDRLIPTSVAAYRGAIVAAVAAFAAIYFLLQEALQRALRPSVSTKT